MPAEPLRHILVVDDEPTVCKLIISLLNGHGYNTFSAANGREALSLFKEHQDEISLLLTDIVMPEMDGVELAVQVRQLQPRVPVLFVSGFGKKLPAAMQGWDALNKPFKFDELLKKINLLVTIKDRG